VTQTHDLADLGWSAFFLSQLDLDDIATLTPARIAEIHRDRLVALAADGTRSLVVPGYGSTGDHAVGDWVLADAEDRAVRRLDRTSELRRRAVSGPARIQLIAANVDTLFVVTSCNADFSVARLERYLAVAWEAGVLPVVILTKADLADPESYAAHARAIRPGLAVIPLDARDPAAAATLSDWCRKGQTVALAGSSGVGKSTLMNTLAGTSAETRGIREDDARGRHTTTFRALRPLPGGGWIIDTPGMRELGLVDAARGIAATFGDIDEIARGCRFADCRHESEPGCAVLTAIAEGTLDPARLDRWRKLAREEARTSLSVIEARRRERAFGRMVKEAMVSKRDRGKR
jgi:ribosome biogenesis GTPase